jgi:hypothetical protein
MEEPAGGIHWSMGKRALGWFWLAAATMPMGLTIALQARLCAG